MKHFRTMTLSGHGDNKAEALRDVAGKVASELSLVSDLFDGAVEVIHVQYEQLSETLYMAVVLCSIEHPRETRYKLTALGQSQLARSTKK